MKKALPRFLMLLLSFAMISSAAPALDSPVRAFTASVMRHGSTGANVRELQSRLKLAGFYGGKIDGVFGWRTYWAVRLFQYRFGMKVDGVAGAKTKAKLAAATKSWHGSGTAATTAATTAKTGRSTSSTSGKQMFTAAPSVSGITKSDMNLLAHLVAGEARGEPFQGQVAVAAVILHRVKSPKFPNTVAGVIYQPGAFSAATNGQINVPVNSQAMAAVVDAVKGWDPSHGALYYFNPAKTNNRFVWSRPEITKIGHHIFTM